MKKEKLMMVKVFSKVEDKNIKSDILNSPIWKGAKHLEDRGDKEKGFIYSIYFEGVTPVGVTSVSKV